MDAIEFLVPALEELMVYPLARLEKHKRTAFTRAHPVAPNTQRLLTLAAPLAAIYDRFNDRLQSRPLYINVTRAH